MESWERNGSPMKIKNDTLIKKWEELRLEAYLPTPNDVWTIGWGHTLGVTKGMVIAKKEAQDFFDSDVAWVNKALSDLVKVDLTQNQYDALASLVFNIGRTQFSTSTLLRKLNAGDYEGASEQFHVWKKQKGKTLNGLVRRRAEEAEYFLQADESPSSVSVDPETPMKPLAYSKEVISGAGAALTGVGGVIASLNPSSQLVISVALSVALLAFGGYILYNRLQARKEGSR